MRRPTCQVRTDRGGPRPGKARATAWSSEPLRLSVRLGGRQEGGGGTARGLRRVPRCGRSRMRPPGRARPFSACRREQCSDKVKSLSPRFIRTLVEPTISGPVHIEVRRAAAF